MNLVARAFGPLAALLALVCLPPAPAPAAPPPPTHLTGQGSLRGAGLTEGLAVLRWQAGLQARACRVYRDHVLLAQTHTQGHGVWQWVDNRALPGASYTYTVTDTDRTQAESLPSVPVVVAIPPVVAPKSPALPTPVLLTAQADDRNVLLTWAVPGTGNQDPNMPGPLRPDQHEPSGVSGFLVTWGPLGRAAQFQKLSVDRIAQLQPLVPGEVYTATVQSVDALGETSPPSASVTFAHDPARVNALRTQMTGFFDDFDTPAGPLDEQKWNTSYASGDDPALSGAFVNAQFHAHDMVSNAHGFNDREWVMNRPRAVFDVAGRTGTLVFDMDGEFRRDQWYLDLVPESYAQGVPDTTGQTHLEDGKTAAHPGNFIRIHQTNQTVGIYYINPQGVEVPLARTDWTRRGGLSCAPLDWQGLKLVPNVRRHWTVRYSQTHCALSVDGVPILEADYRLDYARVVPLWLAFSYNTLKSNEPVMLLHWDNFGFDGPPSPLAVHNYKAALDPSDFAELQSWQPNGGRQAYTLRIPDSLDGAVARRMMLSLACRSFVYGWGASDHVSVNGHDFAIADPVSATGLPETSLVSGISGYPVVLNIPDGVFHTGDNLVAVSLASSGVLNVHAEFDFPQGAAPPYTTPMAIYDPDCASGVCPPGERMPGMPPMPVVGPGTYIASVGNVPTPYLNDDSIQGLTLTLSRSKDYGWGPGLVPVQVAVTCDTDLASSGTIHGVHHVALALDTQPPSVLTTHADTPSPGGALTFLVDIGRLAVGIHALSAVAYAPNGTPGGVDYDGALSKPGLDYALHVQVQP